MRHIRAANLCSKGSRAWFLRHGLSWTDFLRDGVPAATLTATGDPLAARAVAAAEKEDRDGQGR
jgi:hypothetical protein